MTIEFDKRLELLYGLLYTVDKDLDSTLYKGLFIEELPTYCREMYNLCKNNMSDELYNYIKEYGISTDYNQPAYIALSMDDNYNIIENDDLKERVIKINSKFNKEKIETLLKDFVLKSNYEEFYNKHKPLYDKIIESFKESMNNNFEGNIILDFYGYKLGNMSIKLYNFTTGSQGILIDNNQYYIQRVDNIGKDENSFVFKNKINTLFHEFSHPYITPLVEKYFKDMNFINLFNETKTNGLPFAYHNSIREDNSYILLNEYLVRSIAYYLESKYVDSNTLNKRLQIENNNGFIHIEKISKLFDDKNNYKDFEDFFKNEIVSYCVELNNSINMKR